MSKTRRTFTETALRETVKPRAKRPVAEPPRLDPRAAAENLPEERGGYDGPEPTRYGDWEHKGRCTDF